MDNPKTEGAIAKIIQRCWEDDGYQARFMKEPHAVLKEAGVEVPEGLQIKVVQNTDDVQYLAIPAKPGAASGELDDSALEGVAGGAGGSFSLSKSKKLFIKKIPMTGLGGGTHDPGNACIPNPC